MPYSLRSHNHHTHILFFCTFTHTHTYTHTHTRTHTDVKLSKLAEYADKRLKRLMENGKGVRRLVPTFFEISAVEVM